MKAKRDFFYDIGRLYTLRGAAKKGSRHVQEQDLSSIDKAALLVIGGKIAWVGREKAAPSEIVKGAVRHSLAGAKIIPALIESHTHLLFAGNRAGEFERRNRGETYQSIAASGGGIRSTVAATRKVSEEHLLEIAQARIERFLRQGVATVEVKSGYGLSAASELKMLKVAGKIRRARVVRTFLGAHAIAPEARDAESYIEDLVTNILPQVANERLATRADIFVEKGYFSIELARRYLSCARDLGFSLVVHADQLSRTGGALLAVEMANKLAKTGRSCTAEHLLQITAGDMSRLAKSEVTCGLLPTSDLYMNCPYPNARGLIDRGARVALATDFNPGTSPSGDVALVGLLARLQMKMTLPEVLAAYTTGAAHAVGLQDQIGSLEVGKSADFAVLDGDLEDCFYDVGRMPVTHLFAAGRCLVK